MQSGLMEVQGSWRRIRQPIEVVREGSGVGMKKNGASFSNVSAIIVERCCLEMELTEIQCGSVVFSLFKKTLASMLLTTFSTEPMQQQVFIAHAIRDIVIV